MKRVFLLSWNILYHAQIKYMILVLCLAFDKKLDDFWIQLNKRLEAVPNMSTSTNLIAHTHSTAIINPFIDL